MCLCCIESLCAQSIPAEWLEYLNNSQYLHEVRTGHISQNVSESIFCEDLRQSAIVGLALQIEVQVGSVSTTYKEAHKGHSHTIYQSTSTLSSNIDLQVVRSDVRYNHATGEGVAIAWIDKQMARQHYLNEVRQLFCRVEGCVKMAEEYTLTGYDKRAIIEYEQAHTLLQEVEKHLSRLFLFELDEATISHLSACSATLCLAVKQGLRECRHGQSIYLMCCADLFGTPQTSFESIIKGGLSIDGCNFVTSAEDSDWCVEIAAMARQQQVRNMEGMSLYTAYVDATITINNCKTGKVVYAGEVTVKGSHTVSYAEAACTAYEDLKDKILQIIKMYIN